MKLSRGSSRVLSLLFAALVVLGLPAFANAAPASHLVISQLYGAGGNSGANWRYDFVQLYNPTASAVDLTNYTIQYASTTGNSWSKATIGGTIQPGKYYLVQVCIGTTGSTNGALLPVPDATVANTDNSTSCVPAISGTNGKLALVSNTTALSGAGGAVGSLNGNSCPTTNTAAIVDFVGFGPAATCYEGSGPTAILSATTSAQRNTSATDTDDNKNDFTVATAAPSNSAGSTTSGSGGGGGGSTPVTAISTLQANRSTYVGTTISTTGVVTSVIYNGFFLQMPGTPASRTSGIPEGIDVFTSTAPTVHVGDNITVTGSLTLYPLASASVTPALEIASPTITTNSTGNALPAPIVLTTADLTPTGGLQQLTRYESMRVQMSLTATSGTGASGLSGAAEVNETYTSNGYFYAVMTGTSRPYREPGVDVRDAGAAALPSTIKRFDDNPERIYVATTLMNGAALDVSTGATFSNVTGVLDFTYSNDSFYDPSRFIPDAGVMQAAYVAGIQPVAAALPTAKQATVATFNIERFFNTSSADDKDNFPASSSAVGGVYIQTSQAVDVTQAAYTRRLAKVSLAIRHMLNNPDIIGIEEAENGFVLKDIAAQISTDAVTAGEADPKYVAYGTDNSKFYSNDYSGISVGFLVKSTVNVTGFDQYFATNTFTPTGGNLTTTDDRPPFVLHAGIKRGTGTKDYPLTVIVNHLKALPDTTTAVQQKKELQVEELAGLFQSFQAKGEHVLAVGDFNAFEFNDGYGDYLGTATNNVVAAPATTVTPGKAGLVTPAPTDLALTLPANLRYSYVESGSAQILDHVVASADIAGSTTLAYVHINADFPNTLYNDATTPARTSDHDPGLAYLTVPAAVTSATLTGSGTFAGTTVVGTSSAGQQITLTNTGETTITVTGFATTGDFAQTSNCGTTLAPGATCAVNVVFTPTVVGTRAGTLTFNGSATVSVFALTGTAVPPPDFSLTDTSSNTTTSLTLAAGGSTTVSLQLTSLYGFSGSVTLTCAAAGTATAGISCAASSPVTLTAGGTATTPVVITTLSRTIVAGVGALPASGGGRLLAMLLAMALSAAVFVAGRRARALRLSGLLMLLFALTLGVSGCTDRQSANPNGTPAGTYNYTVTATSGSLTHTQKIVLTVQ